MNPNSWVIFRSLMSRSSFQALVARMIFWVQISNHSRPTFVSLDTPAASAKHPFAACLPARVQKRHQKTTSCCFAGSLTAHSPMLAPCVRAWLLPRYVELHANPTRFDIQPCSTQGTGYVCKGRSRRAAKRPCLQDISKDLGGRALGG